MSRIAHDILWSRLIGVVNEQAAGLIRSSFTSIVREAGDLSAGVFDRRGRMVAQAVTGTPGHINSMATGMPHILERFPVDSLRPGDVLATNDPWKTASQLNDITVATPVFREGRVVALFASCCHALDIGGRGLAADSRSIFEDGLQLPVMKLHDAGEPVLPVFEIIEANVRAPREVLGDLHSQVVGNEVGGRQLLSFLEEFGLDDLEALSDDILGRSEIAMRERIRALPDGRSCYSLALDGFDDPVRVAVAISIDGDSVEVDFAGSSGPAAYGINVGLNYTAAYTNYALKCVLSPDIPNNEGSFRPVRVRAPEGCILNAVRPAAVGGRHLVGHFIPSAVMGALAELLPQQVMAPGFDGLWDTHLAGVDRRTGKHFSFTWFSAGGTGALDGQDGLSATAYPSGIAGVPAEVIESLAPVVVHRRELIADSGGPGRFRGGLGQRMEFEVLTDEPYLFSGLYERTRHPAPGIAGGSAGSLGTVRSSGGMQLEPKIRRFLPAGERVTIEIPGGGGFGPPEERDPERVRADVREGYVTGSAARSMYGADLGAGDLVPDTAPGDSGESEVGK